MIECEVYTGVYDEKSVSAISSYFFKDLLTNRHIRISSKEVRKITFDKIEDMLRDSPNMEIVYEKLLSHPDINSLNAGWMDVWSYYEDHGSDFTLIYTYKKVKSLALKLDCLY